jgi:hypothetical protein
MIPNSGETVYVASTLDYSDWGIILNLALISERLLRIMVLVYG